MILVWKQLKKKKKKELSVNLSCPRRKILCTRNSASAPLMLWLRPKLGRMFFFYWASLVSSGNTGVSIITAHSLLQMQMWWSLSTVSKKTFVKRQRKRKSRYLTVYMYKDLWQTICQGLAPMPVQGLLSPPRWRQPRRRPAGVVSPCT